MGMPPIRMPNFFVGAGFKPAPTGLATPDVSLYQMIRDPRGLPQHFDIFPADHRTGSDLCNLNEEPEFSEELPANLQQQLPKALAKDRFDVAVGDVFFVGGLEAGGDLAGVG